MNETIEELQEAFQRRNIIVVIENPQIEEQSDEFILNKGFFY